jgi:dTDP-4-dehydrorhamnose reductase
MHIAIVGNGYIGSALIERSNQLNNTLAFLDRSNTFDVESIANRIRGAAFVVNAAGHCGSVNVDSCETEIAKTIRDNVHLTHRLALASRAAGVRLVHLSTGCIFEGDVMFNEESPPNLVSGIYRQTKLLAETIALREGNRSVVLRLRMPFDGRRSPRNLLQKLSSYPRLVDHVNSVTSVENLVNVILNSDSLEDGVYNVACKNPISTRKIAEILGHDCEWFTPSDFDHAVAVKRSACSLSTLKIERAGFEVLDAESAIIEAVSAFKS